MVSIQNPTKGMKRPIIHTMITSITMTPQQRRHRDTPSTSEKPINIPSLSLSAYKILGEFLLIVT